ncbi:putative amidohydrolase family protein [Lyophyllum shimeji]|uniref:Guanine deaminase n=1 Tax=Lyophyllum shimeji TaxID=47721 RepID=A0A9P3PET6_LYOSH|nr:putative amidohydrolase family protein [Lyophyllum shimeji]
MHPEPTIFYGPVISPESLTSYKALPNCLLSVGPSGTIDWLVEDVEEHALQKTLAQKGCIDVNVTVLPSGRFLLPGFIDTHTHAPQLPNIGSGQQYELLDWLSNVTFPTEAKFSDLEFARRTYESVVRRILDCGTTTCCYYGTLHLEATKALADIVHISGQRAFIGKCNMDRNCPEYYVEPSVEVSLRETRELISHIRSQSSRGSPEQVSGSLSPDLVQPVLTPRFAVSCTPELLSSLGELASSDPSLLIQTHISENKAEIAFVKELFSEAPHYAGVYESFGLLRHNTILAHAVHLEDAEVELIAERKTGISHCPTSNFNLSSGVAPVGRFLDRGIKVGLGTDVSGGFSPSILNTIQNASIASKILAMQAGPQGSSPTGFANRQLSVATLLYLATLGGAEVCGLEKVVGSFAPGKSFDALIIDARNNCGNPGLWYPDHDIAGNSKPTLDGLLERFLFCGDDRNISRVYVQGRFIGAPGHPGRSLSFTI